jgi:hypothetical protein
MPNDDQIAALVEIARSAGSSMSEGQKNEIGHLVALGLVEPGSENYRLTPAGQKVLDDRGVGANES